jgi:integrase
VSVYKRGDKWYYYVKIKGTRRRGVIPEARTKYQAQEAERRIRDEIFEGKYQAAQSRKTLKQFVEESYTPWAKANKRSWRSDVSRLKPILAYFGAKKLSDISPFQVERYKIERLRTPIVRGDKGEKSKPRSKASVNREIRLLSRVFTLAIANREARSNPVAEVKLLKGENRRTRYLLPEEEERLMEHLTGRRGYIRLIVLVALNTGMRLGEILRLRKSDVDFHRDEVRVTLTKTDKDRFIPMNDRLRSELLAQISGLDSEYLFANPKTGKPFTHIKRCFPTACRLAEIEDFRFHDLRHTAATRMAESGVDPFTIAAILGHKSLDMTASYAHATQQARRRAVEALEEANKKPGHKVGHKQEQRSKLTAVN